MKVLALTLAAGVLAATASARATTPTERAARACLGVPDAERTGAPLMRPEDVTAVEEIKPVAPASEAESPVQRWGARLVLRAQPGVTTEWLQRLAECHLATVAANGGVNPRSPLDVKGASVVVRSVGDGFAVDVTAGEIPAGHEILARARALVATSARAPRPRA